MVLKSRFQKLKKLIAKTDFSFFIIDDPIDLYYLTGLSLSLGRLLLSKKEAALFVDGRYFESARKSSPFPVFLTTGYGSKSTFNDFLLARCKKALSIGFDHTFTSVQRYLELKNSLPKRVSLIPFASPVKNLRQVKDKEEISLLKKANRWGALGYDFAVSYLKEGITEKEVAAALSCFWLQKGAEGNGFEPIIAFGKNAAEPHHRAGTSKLKKGQCVLIDIGVKLDHYNSDMTRVVFFGPPDPRLKKIYAIVAKAQKAALDLCRAGARIGDLDEAARGFISKSGYGEYFTHGLGHGLGLDVHEAPTIKNISPHRDLSLEAGMVITIEPGIYLPGIGGVRIEDAIAITPTGYINLTGSSKSLVILK